MPTHDNAFATLLITSSVDSDEAPIGLTERADHTRLSFRRAPHPLLPACFSGVAVPKLSCSGPELSTIFLPVVPPLRTPGPPALRLECNDIATQDPSIPASAHHSSDFSFFIVAPFFASKNPSAPSRQVSLANRSHQLTPGSVAVGYSLSASICLLRRCWSVSLLVKYTGGAQRPATFPDISRYPFPSPSSLPAQAISCSIPWLFCCAQRSIYLILFACAG